MRSSKPLSHVLAWLISCATFATPIVGQQEPAQPTASAKPAANALQQDQQERQIDSLLAVESYKVYGEVKNVGTLVHSGAFAELIDPVMKLADPPKEFRTLVKFVNTNAETLASSRLVFASWPAQPNLPSAFFVIELASADDAAKFEPKLNKVLPAILPTPTPSPSASPGSSDEKVTVPAPSEKSSGEKSSAVSATAVKTPTPNDNPPPPAPPFVVSRAGNLIFITDKPFKFESLRPADSKLLAEDQNFRQARERFATEPVFLFINVALSDAGRNRAVPEEKEAEEKALLKEQAVTVEEPEREMEQPPMPGAPGAPGAPDVPDEDTPEPNDPAVITTVQQPPTGTLGAGAGPSPTPPPTQNRMLAIGSFLSLLDGGPPEWPDAVGIAIAQEADDYVIRSILIGPPNGKRLVLPFLPQLLAGRGLTPNAPSVLPEDTEVLVSASFDWAQTYQLMLARLEISNKERAARLDKISAAGLDEKPYDPFTDFEQKGGFKIKDDLLPMLGNEISFASSMKTLQGLSGFGIMMAPRSTPKPSPDAKQIEEDKLQKQRDAQTSPMVLIAVRDREAARRLVPKVLDGLGIGAANMIGAPVKVGDSEMVDFAGAFAYAFIDDFLVISTTPTVRRVMESHTNHQTLAANSAFRDYTRWQPRDLVGQIYVSPELMASYTKAAHDPKQTIAPAMREYLLRLNPTPQPMTYAYANEGYGAIHELHLPKSFVLANVAGAASATKEPPPEMNEAIAMSMLRMIVSAEATYQSTTGKGSYGSLDKLIEAKLIAREPLDRYGYRFEVSVSGNQFEATATPIEYGKHGRLSYFVDQSGVVRGGDHGGGAASAADSPMQ